MRVARSALPLLDAPSTPGNLTLCYFAVATFFAAPNDLGQALVKGVARSHLRLSMAGEPLTVAPGATSPPTPDCAVTMAPSPIVRWPTTPT